MRRGLQILVDDVTSSSFTDSLVYLWLVCVLVTQRGLFFLLSGV